jgi:hypothetical protein
MRVVIPFLKPRYFDNDHKVLFKQIGLYVAKYNSMPTKESLTIEIQETDDINEDNYGRISMLMDKVFSSHVLTDIAWLIDKTEKWCQECAIRLAIVDSFEIIEGKKEKLDKGAIPQLLQDALAVSFDRNIGHSYFADAADRYDFYTQRVEKIPFAIDTLNTITEGGLERKTLNIWMADTGVGKSLMMCSCAADDLSLGRNVLYITCEMAEEKISRRIDANLLDMALNTISSLTRDQFIKKVSHIQTTRKKAQGELVVKEYPTATANVNHFRALLQELKLKKNFVPDMIYIDYLNICTSSRMRMGGSVNSYTYIKAIAEEIRGLAIEFNVPIVSATQTNRSGHNNTDIDLENTSESYGLPQTVDFLAGIMQTEELAAQNKFLIKQLKNRYSDKNNMIRFGLGVDKPKMKVYDLSGVQTSPSVVLSGSDAKSKFEEFTF